MGTRRTAQGDSAANREIYLLASQKIAPAEIVLATVLSCISAAMLFLCVFRWPYGYYTLQRWVVTGTAVCWVHVAYFRPKLVWLWAFTLVALLFNPLIPFHLPRPTWVKIDLAVGSVMVATVVLVVLMFAWAWITSRGDSGAGTGLDSSSPGTDENARSDEADRR